ncbi:hypothetical protein ACLOJK_025229 [Asimina triloba]
MAETRHMRGTSRKMKMKLDQGSFPLEKGSPARPSHIPLSFSLSASLSASRFNGDRRPPSSTSLEQRPTATALPASATDDPPPSLSPLPSSLSRDPPPSLHLPPLLAGSVYREPPTHPRTHFPPRLPALPRDSTPTSVPPYCAPFPFIPLSRPTPIPPSPMVGLDLTHELVDEILQRLRKRLPFNSSHEGDSVPDGILLTMLTKI